MFPDYEPKISIDNSSSETSSNGKSLLFDFSIGDFVMKDGKIQEAEGIEALKIWIEKILKTEKDIYFIYKTYGVKLRELVNSGHQQVFIEAEIQREINEALLQHKDILCVSGFSFSRSKRTLIVSFTVDSIYGITVQEVSL